MKQADRTVLHRWTRHEYERLIDHGFRALIECRCDKQEPANARGQVQRA